MKSRLVLDAIVVLFFASAIGIRLNAIAPLAFPPSTVVGIVFFDVNQNGIFDAGFEWALANVEVQLLVGSGSIVMRTYTNEMGIYVFNNVEAGTYTVNVMQGQGWEVTTPTGQGEQIVQLGGEATVSGPAFGIWAPAPIQPPSETIAMGPPGLTIGFWKTNIGKNLQKLPGRTQVSGDMIDDYLWDIRSKYWDYGDNFLSGISIDGAYDIFCITDASVMKQKAQAQILALLLTAEYNDYDEGSFVYLPDIGQGSYYPNGNNEGMVGAIDYVLKLYADEKYDAAKNLADALNNMPSWGSIEVQRI